MSRTRKSLCLGISIAGFALLGWLAASIGQEGQNAPAGAAASQAAQPQQSAAPAQGQQPQPPAQAPMRRKPAQQAPRMRPRQGPTDEHAQILQECIQQCRECAQVCNRTSWHAYRQAGGNPQMQRVQQLAGDCQAFCDLAARMIERNSPLMVDSCQACENACTQCAEACEQAGLQDQQLAACARKCRQCADACKRMVEHHAGRQAHR